MDSLAANGVDSAKMEELRVMVRGGCSELAEWRKAFTAIWPDFPKQAGYKTACQHAVGALEVAPVPNWAKKVKIMDLMAAGSFADAAITEEVLHGTATAMDDALEKCETLHEAEAVKKTVAKAEEGRGGLNPLIGSLDNPQMTARFLDVFDKESVTTPPEVREGAMALVKTESHRQMISMMKTHGAGPIKPEWKKGPGWMLVREFMEALAMGMLAAVVKLNSGVELDRGLMTRATDQSGWGELARSTTETVGKALAHQAKIDKSVAPALRLRGPGVVPTGAQPKAPNAAPPGGKAPGNTPPGGPKVERCYNCNEIGHKGIENGMRCTKPPFCYNCQKSGHKGPECPEPQRKKKK